MTPVVLDIIFDTDKTRSLRDQGLPYLLAECDIREMTFYHIDCIGSYIDTDKNEYGTISSGGIEYQTLMPYSILKTYIDCALHNQNVLVQNKFGI